MTAENRATNEQLRSTPITSDEMLVELVGANSIDDVGQYVETLCDCEGDIWTVDLTE